MEPNYEATQPQFRSGQMGCASDEFHQLISAPLVASGNSFTALLELPPPQAVELLVKEDFPVKHPPPIFPTDIGLIHRASKFSIFASADNSVEDNSILKFSLDAVKHEQPDSDSRRNSSSPAGSDQSPKSRKRKERGKKVKESNKKSKNIVANETSDDGGGEELPYVHVRARRGQATDSHSLAERARREKINARMKLLQEIVPGCNKISGTALVLDEIINHVQGLQRQVEVLSMRLAAVNPGTDCNIDSIFHMNGASNDSGYTGMFTTPICPEGQMNGTRQLQFQQLWHCDELHQSVWAREADSSNFITPANSLLSYCSSSANSALQHSEQLKMEL